MGLFDSFGKKWPQLPENPVNNFTPRAQQVLTLSGDEAIRLKHQFVGTEHLLLGLIALGQGVAVNVLQRLGLTVEIVRAEVEKQVGFGPHEVSFRPPLTPRRKKVLTLAANNARLLHHTYVGTEHILLGLLEDRDGVAGRIFTILGVDPNETRRVVFRELDPNALPAETRPSLWVAAQPLICVKDVEASSSWYQKLLGCESDHGGKEYERLVSHGRLILQLWDVEHDHGPIGDPNIKAGNGLLLWFEVDDFDGAVARANELKAEIVRGPLDHAGASQMEIWLRDLDGYTVVISARYQK